MSADTDGFVNIVLQPDDRVYAVFKDENDAEQTLRNSRFTTDECDIIGRSLFKEPQKHPSISSEYNDGRVDPNRIVPGQNVYNLLRPDGNLYAVWPNEEDATQTMHNADNTEELRVVARSLLDEPHFPGPRGSKDCSIPPGRRQW
jgi:hypothetical protein